VINTSPGSGVSLIVDSINVIGYKIWYSLCRTIISYCGHNCSSFRLILGSEDPHLFAVNLGH
jgi:hypothetical protein